MIQPKVTNPGWPDPTAWAEELHHAMAIRQAIYDAEGDPLLKRNKAAAMLGLVLSSLMAFPNFKNDSVHLSLKDLLIFLADLDRGRDHPWAAPVNFGGTNITTSAQRELKIWVRAAFGVLANSGYKPVEGYRRIASGLTASGRTGRSGRPVRWQTVQTWCLEGETENDGMIRARLEQWWADFREQSATFNVVDHHGQPVATRDIAGKFADMCWSLPHLRDLI